MQFQTVLKARVPRCACENCGVKNIKVPWAEKHSRFTLLFEAFAIEVLHAARSIDAAALLLSIDWSTAQNIMKRAVERDLERRPLDEVEHVGIDEKSFRKGQDFSLDEVWNIRSRGLRQCYFSRLHRVFEKSL